MVMLRTCTNVVAALLCLAGAAHGAEAQNYPAARPIRLVSPFAPGGSTDTVGRLLAPRLAERLGQNVIVENRPGAGGMIGTSHVVKATPDGHTLLFISGAFTAHSAVTKNLPYDPVRDFAWITMVLSYPFVVVVRADSPVQSVSELIAAAKKSPRKLNYGSVGAGSVFHLAAELFGAMTATEMTHIPFKGGAEPNNELLGGRLDVIFTTTTSAYPQVEAKRMRALAVTSLQPAPQFPGVPTLAQTVPGYEVLSFNGIGSPRATPRPVVARINREIRTVLEQPDIRKRVTDMGNTVQPTTPEELTRKVADDIRKWQRIVAERSIDVQ
ncbi:MAG TPA: tripartite tricarboxylate transporter substrate binding protein [Burkholderiales bacterium]|nr:tripartite tricarboxylate transporter substrate binding protein [Burkholderiales bacterium]